MADNITILDSGEVEKTIATKEMAGAVHANKHMIIDEDGQIAKLDNSTGAQMTVAYAHHEIHSGSHYRCVYNQLVSDTADKSIIAFKTANTAKWCHLVFEAKTSSPSKIYILKTPTIALGDGTSLAVFNSNENSSNTSGILQSTSGSFVAESAMYFSEADMGDVTGGTKVDEIWVGAEKNKGGGSRDSEEIILEQDTLYAFVIENLNADDNYHSLRLNWYEHTNAV